MAGDVKRRERRKVRTECKEETKNFDTHLG